MARRTAGAVWTIAGAVLAIALLGACTPARERDDAGAKPVASEVTYVVQVPGAG